MANIKTVGLTKQFGANTVVDEVDLEIRDGEFVVLLGPSGCGKTTVLRMIAGLEQISGGQLMFDGNVMNSEPPDRRNVGMVFQNYALYPHMTVAKNLSFGLESAKRNGSRSEAKQGVRRKVEQISKLLDIEHLLNHRPKQLSGGQRQRVALGRALIRQPSVFLMDEPLSNLDANLREKVRMELARLHERLAITTIFVTHDQVEALTLADRVVVMNGGRVLQVGTPKEIYDIPADSFVAHFIGTPGMNLWTLPFSSLGGGGIGTGGSVALVGELADVLSRVSGTVTVGVRPEHLEPFGAVQDPGVLVDFRVEMVEHLGSRQLAYGVLADGGTHAAVVQFDAGFPCRRGDRLELASPAEHVHLFSADGGRRISNLKLGRDGAAVRA